MFYYYIELWGGEEGQGTFMPKAVSKPFQLPFFKNKKWKFNKANASYISIIKYGRY
jgi:hypothetical protein